MSLRDKRLSEQLQMDSELTLERGITRQSEQVKKQQARLKSNFKADTVSAQLHRVHVGLQQPSGAHPKQKKA